MATKDKKKVSPLLEEDEEMDTKVTKTSKPAKAKKEVKEVVVEDETENDDEDDVEEDEEEVKAPAKSTKTSKQPKKVDIRESMRTDILRMKDVLSKQPKVRFFIPLGIGEVAGSKSAVESVTINGYRQVFPKGKFIEVPQSVAEILENHYNMTPENTEMGQRFRLDRARNQDGMSTEEALDA